MFRLRDYRPGDIERLYALDQSCFDPQLAYSRTELRFYIRHPATFTIVAEHSEPAEGGAENIAGFLIAHRRRGGVGHVITIDVDQRHRRARVGSLLMSEAENRLRAQGCVAVTLETAVDNVAAISFYLKRGYSIMHTLRGYYSNGLDALVMRKEL